MAASKIQALSWSFVLCIVQNTPVLVGTDELGKGFEQGGADTQED